MSTHDLAIALVLMSLVLLPCWCGCCFAAARRKRAQSIETGTRENPPDPESTHRTLQPQPVSILEIPVTWEHGPPGPENVQRAREATRAAARARTAALYGINPRETQERDGEEHSPALSSFRLQGTVAEETCAICMDPFGTSSVTVGTCMHIFHTTCLTSWLARESSLQLCPVCRARFRTRVEQTAMID